MSKRYVAVIADATASRLLPPARRARLQQDARAAAQQLNRGYARVLAARFAVTLGDELQCLLPGPEPVWEIAHQIRARRPRDRRALLSRGPRRPGPRQAAAPGLYVRWLPGGDRPARELLRRPLLELDAAPAPHRDAVAPGRPGDRRSRAGDRPQRRLASRPPHGLASRRSGR